ncbi:MAG: transposase [Parcubacteria group bacterium]|nr:transposase [Parcubacteria group bacterium]
MHNEFFHLLNRGVDKRNIFLDERDYFRFIHNLFEFNDINNVNPNSSNRVFKSKSHNSQWLDIGCPTIGKTERRPRKLLVNIHFFCLMPNHYHLLVSPLVENGISYFMKKLNMGYSKYFNEKYDRSGALFQGKYKSVHIERDAHFLWIPYYIHFNPLELKFPSWKHEKVSDYKQAMKYLESYRWSSHLDYLGKKNFPSVTQRDFFLESFGGEKKYQNSVSESLSEINISDMENITLE